MTGKGFKMQYPKNNVIQILQIEKPFDEFYPKHTYTNGLQLYTIQIKTNRLYKM